VQALFHRFGAGLDLQGMLVDVCAEKVNEHCFLFGIEGGTDAQCLSIRVSGIEGYEFDVFRGLEVAWRLGSGISFTKLSRFAAKVADSRTASPCSTHSTSHS
jgi:hypothetical protein